MEDGCCDIDVQIWGSGGRLGLDMQIWGYCVSHDARQEVAEIAQQA